MKRWRSHVPNLRGHEYKNGEQVTKETNHSYYGEENTFNQPENYYNLKYEMFFSFIPFELSPGHNILRVATE